MGALELPVGVVLIPETNRAVWLAATQQTLGVRCPGDQLSPPNLVLVVVPPPIEAAMRAIGNGRVVRVSEFLNVGVHVPSAARSSEVVARDRNAD